MIIRLATKKDKAVLKNLLWESLKEEWKFNSDIDLKGGKIFLNKNLRELFKNKRAYGVFWLKKTERSSVLSEGI